MRKRVIIFFVRMKGFEPLTTRFQNEDSTQAELHPDKKDYLNYTSKTGGTPGSRTPANSFGERCATVTLENLKSILLKLANLQGIEPCPNGLEPLMLP
jgi:hypothetical protein